MSGVHYRTGQNLCSDSCPVEHIDIPQDNIQKPADGWPNISGLHSLQYSRDNWLNDEAILVANRVYLSGLPKAVRDKIDIAQPGVDARIFFGGRTGDDTLSRVLQSPLRRMYRAIKAKEYSIWPINTGGNHWVTVVLHKRRGPDRSDDNKQAWVRITEMAVIDSFRNSTTIKMVHTQIRKLLEAGNFTFAPKYERKVWSPLQRDSSSCGPRSYWCAKQFMDRISRLTEDDIDYHEGLWVDLSGWFDEDFVRGEMIGRAAWDAVRAMDYNARVAIECVNRVRKHDDASSAWKNAGRLLRPPKNRDEKPETRPQPTGPSGGNDNNAAANVDLQTLGSALTLDPNTPKNTARFGINNNTPDNAIVISDDEPPPRPKKRGVWALPPMPVANRHRVAAGAPPRENDIVVIDDDDDEEQTAQQKGPAWAGAPRSDNAFIPPARSVPESRLSLQFPNAAGGRGFGQSPGKRSLSPGPDPDPATPSRKRRRNDG